MQDRQYEIERVERTQRALGRQTFSLATVEAFQRADQKTGGEERGTTPQQFALKRGALVTVLTDDSDSLNQRVSYTGPDGTVYMVSTYHDDPQSNSEQVRIGHNSIKSALAETEDPSAILFQTRTLTGNVINPIRPLAEAVDLNRVNFAPAYNTPLYDATIATLRAVSDRYLEFRDAWKALHTVTFILTDGKDFGSEEQIETVAGVVGEVRSMEAHIIAGMGISDGKTDFVDIFTRMGIDPRWILTPKSTPEDIRRACNVAAKAAVAVSRAKDRAALKMLTDSGFQGVSSSQ